MPNESKIYIGTSGWSYPKGEGTWTGHFYPSAKVNELEYYSQYFRTVEINSTFYRPPNPGFVINWVRRVPQDFLFTVKLWQKFTHPKMYQEATGKAEGASQADIDLFMKSIDPLVKYRKLGALLAQFPPSFKKEKRSQEILAGLVEHFGQYGLAIELRHRSWSDDQETAEYLTKHNVSWVQIDEPKFQSSIAQELPLTGDMAYFRFHGRNADDWWSGNSETRYKYLYSANEINELAARVREAATQARLTFAFFNNHWRGYAPRNCVDLAKALQLPFKELVMRPEVDKEAMLE